MFERLVTSSKGALIGGVLGLFLGGCVEAGVGAAFEDPYIKDGKGIVIGGAIMAVTGSLLCFFFE